jgi:hypothetical protein
VFNHDSKLERTVSNGSSATKVGQLNRNEWFQGYRHNLQVDT